MPLAGIPFDPSTSRPAGRLARPFSSGSGSRIPVVVRLLLLVPAVLLSASLAGSVAAQVANNAIRVQVSPDTTLLRPLKDPATITIDVDGAGERPRGPVDLSVRLTAPPPGTFVSSDFPLIEGTRLIDMNLANVTGTLSWDYVFPIRGEYRLDVSATDGQGRRLERSFAIQVPANRAKTAFLAGFVAALFLLGFIAGRIFSAPAGVAAVLMITLLYGAGLNRGLSADTNQSAGLKGELTVAPPRVGSPSALRWRGIDPGTGEPVPATVTLRVVQLEKGKEIFTLNRVPTDGTLDLAFQFTDASPHRVLARATAPGRLRATEVARTVEVESATPSLVIRVWPVLLFIFVVLAGLAAGRFSKRRHLPLPWTAKRVKIHPKEAS